MPGPFDRGRRRGYDEVYLPQSWFRVPDLPVWPVFLDDLGPSRLPTPPYRDPRRAAARAKRRARAKRTRAARRANR